MLIFEVFKTFLRLGLTSFGGPIAHLSFFHNEFVTRKKWISDRAFADLVALCQSLPGPATSQIGIAIGFSKAGYFGAVAAWLGFTLPSAIILILAGLNLAHFANFLDQGLLHGLKIAIVAVVAQAIWLMSQKFSSDFVLAMISLAAAIFAATMSGAWVQISAIATGGLLGWLFVKDVPALPHEPLEINLNRRAGLLSLTVFFILLLVVPVLSSIFKNHALEIFACFFRVGSLVFGGGHVVLPLLQAEVVVPGWVSQSSFINGYGLAQAIPGPLFSFSAYLGAVSVIEPSGWTGGIIALVAMFLPSFLLILGVLPFWETLRTYKWVQRALVGISAVVVGLLLAAFYDPVWTSAIKSIGDFLLAAVAFVLLVRWNVPSSAIVVLCAVIAGLVHGG